jgi:hypothetical protein
MSWTNLEIQKERPPDFSIDATILRVLNRHPIASMLEIARETRPPASTIFYVSTTHVGSNFRRYRLMPHNRSAQQRNDRLKQIREMLEVLQHAKKLRLSFTLTGDESQFFYVNKHQKLWLAPDSDPPEVAGRRINTPIVMITLF